MRTEKKKTLDRKASIYYNIVSEIFNFEENFMYRIGVDLGGTNIAVGIVNENLKLVKMSIPFRLTYKFSEIQVKILESLLTLHNCNFFLLYNFIG